MPYRIQTTEQGLILELQGTVTVRHAAGLGHRLAASMNSAATVVVRTRELEDIDTCVLQLLVSVGKTAAAFVLENPSKVFLSVVDRCALRPEFAGNLKDA